MYTASKRRVGKKEKKKYKGKMKYRKLTDIEREELKATHRKERDNRVCDRIKAVLLYDEGYSLEEIAKILLLSDEGIRKHIIEYHSKAKVKPENGGAYSKLSIEEERELIVHLEANNYVYARDIRHYVKKEYGVKYSIAGVIKLLHRIGFRYKKPKLIPGKLDAAKQEEFKLQYSLLKGNLREDEAIYFMDSVHPQYQTRARYGWIRKNTAKTLPSFSGWKRKHIIGAINLKDLDVVTTDNGKVNGDAIIMFLKKLEEGSEDKRKVYLICDNAGYHKSNQVKEYLKTSKIDIIFLPPYSPNLNPIERLWKYMHSIVTNNRFYADFESFAKALQNFFTNIPKYKVKLKSLITDNFQTILPNHFSNSSS